MAWTPTQLAYRQTGFFSRIVLDYLEAAPALRPFYAHPVSTEGIRAAMDARRAFPTDRALLVSVLNEQYECVPPEAAVTANIASLAEPDTFVVTTAHQPAIFTGTLYFVYKILHAIRLCEHLATQLPGNKFVPVFYMGSEDADLDELGHIWLDGEKIAWDTKQTGAVGRMHPKGLEKIAERIAGEFAGQPFGAELTELMKEVYLKAPTIQEGTFALLHRLFGARGLVVLIPDHARLKKTMAQVFSDDLLNRVPFRIATETAEKLSAAGYPVQANPRETNLFWLDDGLRERIDERGGRYYVHDTKLSFSPREIEEQLEQHPEKFSPNVFLRGLFQETILPGIAFIGGGGELAYWLELKALFAHYGRPYPVLILRNSFLLVDEHWKKKIAKTGLDQELLFEKANAALSKLVKRNASHRLDIASEIGVMEEYFGKIKAISANIDPTLAQHVEALKVRLDRRLETLEKKLLRAEKRKHTDLYRQIEKVRGGLFPNDNLQERVDNFIPFYARQGRAFLDEIYAHSLPLEAAFTILEQEGQ